MVTIIISNSGTIVPGEGHGRELGFPTANLKLDHPEHLPPDGIYACWARLGHSSQRYKAALHVGPRPMFPERPLTVEIHLLDFPDRDLYGLPLSFQCVKRLRKSKKFASQEQLVKAMEEDCRLVRSLL